MKMRPLMKKKIQTKMSMQQEYHALLAGSYAVMSKVYQDLEEFPKKQSVAKALKQIGLSQPGIRVSGKLLNLLGFSYT